MNDDLHWEIGGCEADPASWSVLPAGVVEAPTEEEAAATFARFAVDDETGPVGAVLAAVRGGNAKAREICAVTGQTRYEVSYRLQTLARAGRVESIGKGRSATWRLVE